MNEQLFWFTGQAGAGKTVIGNALKEYLEKHHDKKIVMVDGDDIRELYNRKDYSIQGRKDNVAFVQKICDFLIKNDIIPIVCMVSPFAEQRVEMKDKYNCREIYIYCDEIRGREGYHVDYFEKPIGDYIGINTTGKTIEESLNELLLWRSA